MTEVARNTIVIDSKDKTGAGTRSAVKNLDKVNKQVKGLNTAFRALGGVVAVAALARMTTNALNAADAIAKLSANTGFTVEQIQKYQFAAEQSGVTQDKFNTGLKAFTKRIGELKSGTGGLFTILNKYDKTLLEQLQTTGNVNDALQLMIGRMEGVTDSTELAALSSAAFSRGAGSDMVNFMKSGQEEVKRLGDQLESMGGVMSAEMTANAERANDAMNLFTTALGNMWTMIVVKAAPALETLAGWLSLIVKNGHEASQTVNAFDGKLADLRATISALKGQQGVIGNLFGADTRIADLEEQLRVLTRGSLTDLERKGKESARSFEEVAVAASEINTELEETVSLSREVAIAGGTIEKVWGQIGEKTGGAMGDVQLREANERLREMRAAVSEVNEEVKTGNELSAEFALTWDEIARDTIRGVRDNFFEMYRDIFGGDALKSVESFLKRILSMFLDIIAQIAAAWTTSAIFGGLFGIGGGAGILGGGLGGLIGGGSSVAGTVTSGAGGAGVAAIVGGGAGGGAIVSALPAAAPIPAGTPLGVGAVTSGAGGGSAAGGSGLAAAAPWAAAIAGFVVLDAIIPGLRTAVEALQTPEGQAGNFGPRQGVIGLQGRGFADFAGAQGASVREFKGLGFQVTNFGRGEDDDANTQTIQEMLEAYESLQEILPHVEAAGEAAFGAMTDGAGEIGEILRDDLVDGTERAQLGITTLGDITAEQFGGISNAVNLGTVRMDALTGAVQYTEAEMRILGELGITVLGQVGAETERARGNFGDFAGAVNDTTGAVHNLSDAIRNIPEPPSIGSGGGRGGFATGGQFTVTGKPGTDANIVSFGATAGEIVTIETPGQAASSRRAGTRALVSEFRAMRRENGANVVRELRALNLGVYATSRA